jgi:diacylglycerol kinase
LARTLWYLRRWPGVESPTEAQERARRAANLLEDLVAENKSVFLLGHGYFNVLIARELRHRGWRGPRFPRRGYWSTVTYRRLSQATVAPPLPSAPMTEPKGFSLASRGRSFRFAWHGITRLLATQHNAWIHASATVLVVLAGLALDVSRIDWTILVLAMMAVWSAEALNTAVEALGDAVSSEHHQLVGLAKDVAAGSVLIAATGAAVVAALVFGPHILGLVGAIQ